MKFEASAKIVSMRHFRSKPEKGSKDYYIVTFLTARDEYSEDFQGYDVVQSFTDEGHYNALLNSFKALTDIKVHVEVQGNTVKYSL